MSLNSPQPPPAPGTARHTVDRPATTPIEDLWTVPQAMKFLNVKRTWVYEHCAKGDLPHVRLGNALRFEPDQLREWVRRQRSTAPTAVVLPIAGGRR